MANAACQFTQGVTVGGSGQSVFGFARNTAVTMTDDGGAGAISYLWEILSWPAPLSSPPTITNSTLQVATVTPTLDGVYIVKLTRVDGTGTSTDLKFFGVVDEDNLTLPSAGQTGAMTNQSNNARLAGWAGRANATTNFQLDAFLRFLKSRAGRYVGQVDTFSHVSASPVVAQYTDGLSKPFRLVTITGAGLYTEELVTSPAPPQGKSVRYLVQVNASSGGFVLKNGVGGAILAQLSAPFSGVPSFRYDLECVYTGSTWVLSRTTVVDPKAQRTSAEVALVTGRQSTQEAIPTRIGAGRFDPTKYPTGSEIRFAALIETTPGKTCEIRLYNTTDGGYVTTPLQTTLDVPTWVEQVVTLPNAEKDYEVTLMMTATGIAIDRVSCTNAKLIVRWG